MSNPVIKVLLSDLSRVLLFAIGEAYEGSLNELHNKNKAAADYDFWQHFRLNQPLLDYYQTLSPPLNKILLTTGLIQEYAPLKQKLSPVFSKIITTRHLPSSKKEPATYEHILSELNVTGKQVVFIDDSPANLAAARQAGIQVIHFIDNDSCIENIRTIITA